MDDDANVTQHTGAAPTRSSVPDRPGRSGLAWKSLLVAVGGLTLVGVLVLALTVANTYFVALPEARAFADDSIRGIFQSWDINEYSRRASPELLQVATPDKVRHFSTNCPTLWEGCTSIKVLKMAT